MLAALPFREIWAADFEFVARPGERPAPVCLVAKELRSGKTVRLWGGELQGRRSAPYLTDADSLFVAYYASAEIGCHLVLGWPLPVHVLDLFTEFRNSTNGIATPCGAGLVGAMVAHGLDGVDAVEKDSMRALALRGGPWTAQEQNALLGYCQSDVVALEKLLACMLPRLDLPRALLRGRCMKAAAQIEHHGIPIDLDALEVLRANWSLIQERLIARIDADYGVFEGRSFKADRFAEWLARNDIPWPRLPSGSLALDDDTFRDMAKAHPAVSPIRELRYALSKLRLAELAVGSDGRNRTLLSAFRARTGRNQPSNSKFIFGPAVWLRGLIRPELGYGLAYVDWSQQEFGIAAALSGDPAMCAAYSSGDPYLSFAKQTGAVPPDGTKKTHGQVRDQFKACVLAVQYGMGAESLAVRVGQPVARARDLLRLHRETYPVFWRWSDAVVDYATLRGRIWTVFGWNLRTGPDANARSLRNFPMQANGAEMLRLACSFATERGIRVCAPVHDAILIEAPLRGLDDTVKATQEAMAQASEMVLGGFRLSTDAKIVRYPDRYMDDRGERMWNTVQQIIAEARDQNLCMPAPSPGARVHHNGCTDAPPSNLLSISYGVSL